MFGAPSLDALTLNPSILPGGAPPQVPFAPGYGPPSDLGLNVPPYAPGAAPPGAIAPEGGPQVVGGSSTADRINAFADVLKKFGGLQKTMEKNPLAAQMFQEHQQKTVVENQMHADKLQEFKNADMSSRILESMGLL